MSRRVVLWAAISGNLPFWQCGPADVAARGVIEDRRCRAKSLGGEEDQSAPAALRGDGAPVGGSSPCRSGLVCVRAAWFVSGDAAAWLGDRALSGSRCAQAGSRQLAGAVERQEEELTALRARAGVEQSAFGIERAAQQKLLSRVRELEAENAVLKEDVRVFERVLPVAGEPGAIGVENFRVAVDPVGQYRYRFLLVFSPDKQFPEFQGRLRMLAHYTLGDKAVQLALPLKKGDEEIRLKKMQRREGEFKLPAGAALVGLEAHVLQGDTLKFKRVAKL